MMVLVAVLLWPRPTVAAPVPVRLVEGVTHGFLVLRTVTGVAIASGDLLQRAKGGVTESRMIFRFKDGSVFDETVMFTQERVFTLQSYRLGQRGPVFTEDTEISLERATGAYHVKSKTHTDGREKLLNGTLVLPPDVYNGMLLTVVKNLPKGASETGRVPEDFHAWIITDEVPAFVRFEGPLYATGPVWRIEVTSPRWLD